MGRPGTRLESATCRESPLISPLATPLAPLPIHTHLLMLYRPLQRSRMAPRRPLKHSMVSAPLSSSTIRLVSQSPPPWTSRRLALSIAIPPVVDNIFCCVSARSRFDMPFFRIHHGIASSGYASSAQRTPMPDPCLSHPQLTRHASPCEMHPERPEPVSSEGIVPRPSTNHMRHSQCQAATSSSPTTACTLHLCRHPANHNTPNIISTPSSPTQSACFR